MCKYNLFLAKRESARVKYTYFRILKGFLFASLLQEFSLGNMSKVIQNEGEKALGALFIFTYLYYYNGLFDGKSYNNDIKTTLNWSKYDRMSYLKMIERNKNIIGTHFVNSVVCVDKNDTA